MAQIDSLFVTTADDIVERLATHKTLGSAPREELEWIAAHGTLHHLEEGYHLSSKGVDIPNMYILLSGHVAIFVDRGAGRNKIMDWYAGDVTGVLPYSRMTSPPGDAIVQEPADVFFVPKEHLSTMIRQCHNVTAALVHKMLDRARLFTSSGLHDEKMVSLGKLSAGLAHELNNPAAAIERSASLLEDRLRIADEAARHLGEAGLTAAQLAAVDAVRAVCLGKPDQGVRSPLQQAEREEEIADWLVAHGVDAAVAEPLAETAVTIDALDNIAKSVQGPALDTVLRWTAAGCSVQGMASEIQEAAMRISGIVLAIKGFTHMDQAAVAENLDLRTGLGTTVTVLKSKARAKSIAVTVNAPPDLPRVLGYAGELNQIWANLLDNAIDAAPEKSTVEVTARVEKQRMVVRVVDHGAGIPDSVRPRIFEPFVTSKPVGQGTGLGLDIVRRLVLHNDGAIEFDSAPGRTEFRVFLNLAPSAAEKRA